MQRDAPQAHMEWCVKDGKEIGFQTHSRALPKPIPYPDQVANR